MKMGAWISGWRCVCLYKGQGKPSDEEMETKWSSDGDR